MRTLNRKALIWLGLTAAGWLVVGGFALLIAVSSAKAVDLTYVLTHAEDYAPPKCKSHTCVLSGPGGIVQVWIDHVDRYKAAGHVFVVKGVCASACRLAALRVHATLLPGAQLVYHATTSYGP